MLAQRQDEAVAERCQIAPRTSDNDLRILQKRERRLAHRPAAVINAAINGRPRTVLRGHRAHARVVAVRRRALSQKHVGMIRTHAE